jgi:hypothetical protein
MSTSEMTNPKGKLEAMAEEYESKRYEGCMGYSRAELRTAHLDGLRAGLELALEIASENEGPGGLYIGGKELREEIAALLED